MQILEELWNGNICPIAQPPYRSRDYQQLVALYERCENTLFPTLNDTQKDDLQKMQELAGEMRSIAECSAFISGFRLGVQLMSASGAAAP